ncbi:Fe(2+) transporter permease subunit FeoB [Wohlfahrtiimonas chitiniclastica]|uniref:Fe(2+) transporter permease subunit FeoB n=1 Tax=Wohlfahrtiimonas chitiniclastica TaxID=400946 RepID=UPI000B992C22|nr:Fe(2+) transporter permease subunit FeoB [Wohlfahrtiimonas chitiniclastica]OYQ85031.1 ferrous iron transport protein B [Wohlfahrtiimonas chitiniclastica]OYQ86735.1 ferrous iron transport protein B [Wohlfahrtiimonas chitiniclastica]
MSNKTIALLGNPNCGKTTLFNALTGSNQKVANWPGVTVDKKTGQFNIDHTIIDVVDLPGTYSFEGDLTNTSQDELVVRHYLLDPKNQESIIVNIIDASNLQRSLYLTFQLLDLRRPMIIVLNMMDVARLEGYEIFHALLQEKLHCPVVTISASKNEGIDELKKVIAAYDPDLYLDHLPYKTLNPTITNIIQTQLDSLSEQSILNQMSPWLVLESIKGDHKDPAFTAADTAALLETRKEIENLAEGEYDIAIASARYESIDELAKDVIKTVGIASTKLTYKIDKWALGRFTGLPIFLLVMFLMFAIAINVGSAFIDFFEILFSAIFVDGLASVLNGWGAPDWLVTFLANGIGEGIKTVASFIPVLTMMFLCLSLLEDSGYMARAAMVVDRGMRAIGLPGKAFVPMLVGFGCNIPAIMGTRTLESHRDRLMSIMMIPFMSCGARLPVYALFAAIFFPTNVGMVVYLLYLLGIVVAIFTGFALKFSILKGPNTPFIMELPAYHLPTFKGIMLTTWERLKSFIYKAGKAIILVVAILGILNSWGTDGSFGNADSDKSVLSSIGRTITPAFEPMGITEENWPATVGIFTGIFAKESVIGTLNALYSHNTEHEDFNFWATVGSAFATIPENLAGIPGLLLDPLGISEKVADGDLETIKNDNEVDDSTVTQIQQYFTSDAAVIAYLIFILLYTPCVAALGSVYREAGAKWTILVASWTFIIGWLLAVAYYQASLLSAGSSTAMFWIMGTVVALFALFMLLRWMGHKEIFTQSHAIVAQSHVKRCCDDNKKCCG